MKNIIFPLMAFLTIFATSCNKNLEEPLKFSSSGRDKLLPEYYDEVYGIKTSGAINFAKYVFNLLYPDQFRNFSWTGMNFSVDFYTREDLEEVFDFNYEDSVSNDTLMYIVNITNNNVPVIG